MKDWLERVRAYLLNRTALFKKAADASGQRTDNQPPAGPAQPPAQPAQPPAPPPANPLPKVTAKLDKEKVKAIAAKAVGDMAKKAMATAAVAEKLAKEQRKRAEDAKKVAKKAIQAFASAAKLAAAEADEKKTAKLKKEKEVAEEIAKEAMKAAKLAEELADAADAAQRKAKEDAAAEVEKAAAAMAKAAAEAAKKATADAAAADAAKKATAEAVEKAAADAAEKAAADAAKKATAEAAAAAAEAEAKAAKMVEAEAAEAERAAAEQAAAAVKAVAKQASALETAKVAIKAVEKANKAEKSVFPSMSKADELPGGLLGGSRVRISKINKMAVLKWFNKGYGKSDSLFVNQKGGDYFDNYKEQNSIMFNFKKTNTKNILNELCDQDPKQRADNFVKSTVSYLQSLNDAITPESNDKTALEYIKKLQVLYKGENEKKYKNDKGKLYYGHPLAHYFDILGTTENDLIQRDVKPMTVRYIREKYPDLLEKFAEHIHLYQFLNDYNDQFSQVCNMSIPKEGMFLKELQAVLTTLSEKGTITKPLPDLKTLGSAETNITDFLGSTESAKDLIRQTALGRQNEWVTEYMSMTANAANALAAAKGAKLETAITPVPAAPAPLVEPSMPFPRSAALPMSAAKATTPATSAKRPAYSAVPAVQQAELHRIAFANTRTKMLKELKQKFPTKYEKFVAQIGNTFEPSIDITNRRLNIEQLNKIISSIRKVIETQSQVKNDLVPTKGKPETKSRFMDQPRTSPSPSPRPQTTTPQIRSSTLQQILPLKSEESTASTISTSSDDKPSPKSFISSHSDIDTETLQRLDQLPKEGVSINEHKIMKLLNEPGGARDWTQGGGDSDHLNLFVQKSLILYMTSEILFNTYMMQEILNISEQDLELFAPKFDAGCKERQNCNICSGTVCENDFQKFAHGLRDIFVINSSDKDIKTYIEKSYETIGLQQKLLDFEPIPQNNSEQPEWPIGYYVNRRKFNKYLIHLCKYINQKTAETSLLNNLISLLDVSVDHYLSNLELFRASVEKLNDDAVVNLYKDTQSNKNTVITYIRFRNNNTTDYNHRFETYIKYNGIASSRNATSFVMNYKADALPYNMSNEYSTIKIPEDLYARHNEILLEFPDNLKAKGGGFGPGYKQPVAPPSSKTKTSKPDVPKIDTTMIPNFVQYQVYGGPFTRIFFPEETNDEIAKDCTEVISSLKNNKSVFMIGYGASGAGKTSTLVYFNGNGDSKRKQDGVLIYIIKEILNKDTDQTVNINAFEFSNPEHVNGRKTLTDYEFMSSGEDIVLIGDQTYTNVNQSNQDFKKDATLSDILLHIIQNDRLVISTTNNPQSSRSHVLIQVQFTPTTYLFIGDFAGVENKFDCADSDTLERFAKVSMDGSSKFYQKDQLMQELNNENERMINEHNTRTAANARQKLPPPAPYPNLTQNCKVKLEKVNTFEQINDLYTIDWFTKPESRTIIETISLPGKPAKVATKDDTLKTSVGKCLQFLFKLTFQNLPFDKDYVQNLKTMQNKTLEMFARAFNGVKNETFPHSIDFLTNAPVGALSDDTPYLHLIAYYYDKSHKRTSIWGNDGRTHISVKTFRESMQRFFGLNSSLFGVPLNIPRSSSSVLTTIQAFELINFVNDMMNYTVKQYNDNVEELCNAFTEFWPKACGLQSACRNRTFEGVYINQSLKVLRRSLSKQLNTDMTVRPNFLRKCALLQCNAMIGTCFNDSPDVKDDANATDAVFAKINSIVSNPADLVICIMCVVNLSRSANNPPPVPYIDTRDLKIELGRFRKRNISELTQLTEVIDGTPFLKSLMEKYTLTKKWSNPKIDMECFNHVRNMCTYYHRMGYLPSHLMTNLNKNIDGLNNSSTQNIAFLENTINELDTFSAASTLGTIMMVDTISKLNRDYIPCMNRIDTSYKLLTDPASYNIPLSTNIFKTKTVSSNQSAKLESDAYVLISSLDKKDKRRGPKAAGGARKKSKKSKSKSKSIK